MKRSHLALILVLAVSVVASAHNGITGFIPTIPDPNAMVIDGSEDDWAWIDPDFIIAPEQIEAQSGDGTGFGGNGVPDDWSASYRMGWSPPPDNSLYLFARVTDDTLGAAESEVKRNWWNDDSIEFNMDMDHSGGPMSWTSTEEVYNGYRINIHPLFDSQLGGTISIDLQEPGLEDWGALPPYCTTAATLLPADAGHLSPNVEYTYEMKISPPFVRYDILGPESSIPHVFAPDQVIGLHTLWMDRDQEAHGQQSIFGRTGSGFNTAENGDKLCDYVIIETVDLANYPTVSTAVEHTTWGRIKNHISR